MAHSDWQVIYQELADVIGEEATLKVFMNFRGSTANFPLNLVRHDVTVQHVRFDYQQGCSIHQLSQKYDLAERTVRNYLQHNRQTG